MTDSENRRTRITHQRYLYWDAETGTWGDRCNLVILALWDDEAERFEAMSDQERREAYGERGRYFGNLHPRDPFGTRSE